MLENTLISQLISLECQKQPPFAGVYDYLYLFPRTNFLRVYEEASLTNPLPNTLFTLTAGDGMLKFEGLAGALQEVSSEQQDNDQSIMHTEKITFLATDVSRLQLANIRNMKKHRWGAVVERTYKRQDSTFMLFGRGEGLSLRTFFSLTDPELRGAVNLIFESDGEPELPYAVWNEDEDTTRTWLDALVINQETLQDNLSADLLDAGGDTLYGTLITA